MFLLASLPFCFLKWTTQLLERFSAVSELAISECFPELDNSAEWSETTALADPLG